jgi:hypothetical protein
VHQDLLLGSGRNEDRALGRAVVGRDGNSILYAAAAASAAGL